MNRKKTQRIIEIAIFTAIVIVLQIVATFIKFGSFPITLTLIPIIIAGAVYGPFVGALMGLVFGIIVCIMVVTGADAAGLAMFTNRPFITIFVCLLKGVLAGLIPAYIYKALEQKNQKLAIIIAAASSPIINTLTLYIILIIFFENTFAGMVAAFMSINFIIELLTNTLIAPGLIGTVRRAKSRYES